MAINLDPRQRAMLQEMGITLWMPKPATAPLSPPAPAVVASPAVAIEAAPTVMVAATPPVAVPTQVYHAAPAPSPTVHIPPAAAAPEPEAVPSVEWQMAPAVQAYPTATGGDTSDAWLVVWECANPQAPLEGDTGKLLNNMLRALRLHHSPHVWIASMQRPGAETLPVNSPPTGEPATWQDLSQGLATNVLRIRPARILLLGMQAARAVLASTDALGRLRAQLHQVHQVPTVVSYDPAYLLRSPHAKPAAWTDLCRAHALRPPSAA